MEHSHHHHPTTSDKPQDNSDQQWYVCPMHPDIVQQGPGKCPKCGMDLVPIKKKETDQLHNRHQQKDESIDYDKHAGHHTTDF
jgi:Cu2+-exporting ATPase